VLPKRQKLEITFEPLNDPPFDKLFDQFADGLQKDVEIVTQKNNKMKIVKVTYTTKAGYSEQNQNNINNVMADLQKQQYAGINYNACLSDDNKTFIHTAFFRTSEDQKLLNELPSFKLFQEQLKASGLEVSPKQELLTLVGSSTNIFNL
jgi:hypothetical protein